MFDFGTLKPLVQSLVSLRNQKEYRNFLTEDNFEVVNVRFFLDQTGQFNTILHVKVDKYPGLLFEIPDNDRYELRHVFVKRLDLEQAVRMAGGKFNSIRRHIVDAANNKEDAIKALAPLLHIDPDEVTWRATEKEVGVLTAKSTSVGYTGHVTLGVFDIDHPFPVLKTIFIAGDRVIRYGKPVQFSATWDEPDYVPISMVWSIRADDLTGIYINADTGLVYTDRLATVEEFTVVVTIDGKEATYVVTLDPNQGDVIDPTSITIQGSTLMHPGEEQTPTLIVKPDGAYVKPRYPIWSISSNITLDGISIDSETGRITVAEDAVETTFTVIAIVDALVARLEVQVVRIPGEPPVLVRAVITGRTELEYGDTEQLGLRFVDSNYVPVETPVWSTNKSIITEGGLLTAIDPGTHLITCVVDGLTVYHVIAVTEPKVKIDDLQIVGPDVLPMYESHQYKWTHMPPEYTPRYSSWWVVQEGSLVYHSGWGRLEARKFEGEVELFLRVDQVTVSKKITLARPYIKTVAIYDAKEGIAVEDGEIRQLTYIIKPDEALDELENVRWSSIEGVNITADGKLSIDVYTLKQKDFVVDLRYMLPNDPTEHLLQYQMFASSKPKEFTIELPDEVEANSDNPVKITIVPEYITVAEMDFKIVPPVANASVVDGRLLLNGAPYESIITVVGTIDTMTASDNTYVKYPDLTGIAIAGEDFVIAQDDYPLAVVAVPKDALLPTTELTWELVEPIPEGVTLDVDNKVIHTTKEFFGTDILVKATFAADPNLDNKMFTVTKTVHIRERVLVSMTIASQELTRDVESAPFVITERPVNADYLGGTWALIPEAAGTVTTDGKVTVTSPLVTSVTVQYTSPNAIVGSVEVKVNQPLISVSIALAPDYLRSEESSALRYALYPPAAVDPKDGVWEIVEGGEFATISGTTITASNQIGKLVKVRYTVGGKVDEREYEILPVPLEAMTVTIAGSKLVRDRTEPLILTHTPTNATILGEGEWVYNVDKSKVIIGEGPTITVLADDIKILSGSYTVDGITAEFAFPVDQPARSLTIVTNPVVPIDNKTMSLSVVPDPAGADIDPVTWSIVPNNPETELYDGNMVRLFNEGGKTVAVTVVANGVTATRDVAIQAVEPTAITIPPWVLQLAPANKVRRLDVQFTPADATDPTGTWEIIPATAGEITDGNLFTPNTTQREVTVKFTHTRTGMTVSGKIPIDIPVTDVEINLPDELPDFSTFTPSFKIVPENAYITEGPVMEVKGPDQMVDNGDGTFTLDGVDVGEVRVTVYVNGEVFSKVANIVPQLPTKIEIHGVPETITRGDKFQLTVTYEPDRVSDPVIYWKADPLASVSISPTGFVEVIDDATDGRALFTVFVGPSSTYEYAKIVPVNDYHHAFTPVSLVEKTIFRSLLDKEIIENYQIENPIVYGFRTVDGKVEYVADIIYEMPRTNTYGYTFRIPVDVWDIISDPANVASNALALTIAVNGQTYNYGCNDIMNSFIQLGQDFYFYVDNKHYPTQTGVINVTASALVSPTHTDNYSITVNVKELKPSIVTPVHFTATQLNTLTEKGFIDGKMTGMPIDDIVGTGGSYQVELQVPRKGTDDYAVYGLFIDDVSWEAIKRTYERKSNQVVIKLQNVKVTAEKLINGSIQDLDRGGWIYPVRVYRYTPDLEVVNVYGTYDIRTLEFGIGNTIITVVRRREGWKPGDGRTFKVYVVPSTDVLVKAAIAQKQIANNVVRTARVTESQDEDDLWIIDAFYPTNEASRTVAISYVIPDDTIEELERLVAEEDNFKGIQIWKNDALSKSYTAKEFLDALTIYENNPFFVTQTNYQTIPESFNLVLDFDGDSEYYYESYTAKAMVRFEMAEIARMTPVTTPEWVMQEWDKSPHKSEYFNSEVIPYLTGLTYKAAFPYSTKAQGTLLAFSITEKTYNKILALDATTPVMRALSGGVAKTMMRDELLANILVSGDEYYFVDEAYALTNNAQYNYRYDWDGNLMDTETGTTAVYLQYTMAAKPEDPRIMSKVTPTQLTANIMALGKAQGALKDDTTLLAKVETTWANDSAVTVKTTVPYREDPTGIRYAISLFVNKQSMNAIKTLTEQDGIVYRERRTIMTETGERPVLIEFNAPMFLADKNTVVDGDVAYRFLEFTHGEKLENVEFDLDWDGVKNDFRPNTLVLTHNSTITVPPTASYWQDVHNDATQYARIVTLVQTPYGAANMVPYFEFTEAVEMETIDLNRTSRLTTFVANAIAPANRWYAPIPLQLDTATYNVIMALYNVAANKQMVIGSYFDSRTTITRQFTLQQFVETFTVNDSYYRRFHLNHVVNLGGEDSNYYWLLTFDFDIAGFSYETSTHRIEVDNRRMVNYDMLINYNT